MLENKNGLYTSNSCLFSEERGASPVSLANLQKWIAAGVDPTESSWAPPFHTHHQPHVEDKSTMADSVWIGLQSPCYLRIPCHAVDLAIRMYCPFSAQKMFYVRYSTSETEVRKQLMECTSVARNNLWENAECLPFTTESNVIKNKNRMCRCQCFPSSSRLYRFCSTWHWF